ncbi:MAG: formate dehydrogenase accessory sulfurtransferase FdhD [Acidimicrobiia bacterium]|nr:formate dehydrogenase accessory sulfurtransferase FdhD [Acidimicrobiia bacterium]
MAGVTAKRRLVHIQDGVQEVRFDNVVAEEPLEIRVDGSALAVTMRTPGNDFELAAGFLVTEGVVDRADQIRTLRYCVGDDEVQEFNVLNADLSADATGRSAGGERSFMTTSSCGLCGKTSIDTLRARSAFDLRGDTVSVAPSVLASLPGTLRSAQRVFDRTGGLHAAGLFTADGELVCLREDVGRHNAFDKVIGWAALEGRLPLRRHVILASGRASFELTQKALMAGIPVLASVSAPSSLAVQLAEESGMTLLGFLRGPAMNVYAGEQRVSTSNDGA